jgi:hypothetical protein
LFEQLVTVTLSSNAPAGVQLAIKGVDAKLVRNASSATGGVAYVQRAGSALAGSTVAFLVEYYLADRNSATLRPDFGVVDFTPLPEPSTVGQVLTPDRDALLVNGRFLIEFASTPGRSYLVQYSVDMANWQSAVPPVAAAGTRTQWYDDGPPKTVSKPDRLGSRFYRVIEKP